MAFILSSAVTVCGAFGLAKIAYNTATLLWIHFLRPSKLHKYLHVTPSSWALVTGSSDGIGLELAHELLAQGFNVFLHGRNTSKLKGVKQTLQASNPTRLIEIIVADASDPDVDYTIIRDRVSSPPDGGHLTVLINCVGGITTTPMFVPLDRLPGSDIDTNIAINARFPTRLTSALLPILKSNSPALIINAGSYAGIFGLPYIATYTSTKAYIHTFTRALRAEVECTGFGAGVEVMGSLIFDTATSRNESKAGVMTVSARDCARGMLAKVGCGETLVAPDWRHWLTANVVFCLPEGVSRRVMYPELRKRREEEVAKLEGDKKGS
jgi:17beta-estradiol 17-dehydrogenase / very-long-chain 3-oxoacyl-CoA reductase